ncbi:TPA: ead/Ea22-like family protein [Klebsiella pneumoniae]|nr:ead/Ea22-like family protein [Klebsiella pneumoniae]HCJ3178627.1 ead/Ea22-like family protein [Klebsiella pneumoniae]
MAYQAGGAELVEALEKAQQYSKERDAENQDLMLTVGRLRVEREELVSRTVKLPEVRITVAESRRRNMTWRELGAYNEGADVTAERIGKALTDAAIKWEGA